MTHAAATTNPIDTAEMHYHVPHLYTRAAERKIDFINIHTDTFNEATALITRDGDWVESDNPFAPDHETHLDWVPEKGVGVRLRESSQMVEGFRTVGEVFRPLQIIIDHDDRSIRVR